MFSLVSRPIAHLSPTATAATGLAALARPRSTQTLLAARTVYLCIPAGTVVAKGPRRPRLQTAFLLTITALRLVEICAVFILRDLWAIRWLAQLLAILHLPLRLAICRLFHLLAIL